MNERGFSLVEALVSIAVLSVAAVSVLVLMAEQSRTMVTMQNRTLARIAADNLMVSEMTDEIIRSENAMETGEVLVADMLFDWERKRSITDIDSVVEITYSVRLKDSEQTLASVTRLRLER